MEISCSIFGIYIFFCHLCCFTNYKISSDQPLLSSILIVTFISLSLRKKKELNFGLREERDWDSQSPELLTLFICEESELNTKMRLFFFWQALLNYVMHGTQFNQILSSLIKQCHFQVVEVRLILIYENGTNISIEKSLEEGANRCGIYDLCKCKPTTLIFFSVCGTLSQKEELIAQLKISCVNIYLYSQKVRTHSIQHGFQWADLAKMDLKVSHCDFLHLIFIAQENQCTIWTWPY